MMAAVLSLLEMVGEWVVAGTPGLDPLWIAALSTSAALFVTLRTMKRRTRLLDAPGR